jgi:lipopolysaccharide export system protein LptA
MRTLILAAALAVAPAAMAEKADREKEIQVLADRLTADDTKREAVYDGNVIVTQGTLRVVAARIVVREDAEGYRSFVATGGPVTFRQKRDKTDDWVEGEAQRAEFDVATTSSRLYTGALLKELAGRAGGRLQLLRPRRGVRRVTGSGAGHRRA